MYRFCIHFYLLGSNDVFDFIKGLNPLENFTHEYEQSGDFDKTLAEKADVIFADIRSEEIGQILDELTFCQKTLILLINREQLSVVTEFNSRISDIWVMPMDKAEMEFRVLKWQKDYKEKADLMEKSIFLDAAINSTPNLVWFKSRDGIHEKVNDSFCSTVHKSKDDVEGKGHAYIWNVEKDDPACIESDNRVMEEKRLTVSEETIDTGDGKRLLTTYKSPIVDFNGQVMGTVGIAVDITKERKYELQILNRNRTLEKIFANIDCGVICHTVDGKDIISVNDAALRILGYSSIEELKNDGFDMVANTVLDEDKKKLREDMASLKAEGDSIDAEYTVCHADGKILHVMGNVKLLKENGMLFYRRYLLDVTAQKKIESAREKRHAELTQALTIEYNLVCFFNLDTGVGSPLRAIDCHKHIIRKYFNGKVLSLDECIHNYLNECVCIEDRELVERSCSAENLIKELSDKKSYTVVYRTMCNENLRYYQAKAVRTGEWSEKRHNIVLGFRSVDKEIRNEMEKTQMLEEALMQAEQANKAKTLFLSNMSHDIRTPMNAILGFTNIALSRMDKTDQVEECLKKIMASGDHLLSLINDVLDMSHIESGKMHITEKPCKLSDVVHSIRNILQADVRAKKLKFNIRTVNIIHEEMICDMLRLNQVLINLLSNSVKYTPEGGTITFTIREIPGAKEDHAYYRFIVKDTGIGMSEEFVSHIFEPFERERNTTISGVQGTGLGMAITKNIVDMMGGTIEVKSKKNEGTECIVDFAIKTCEPVYSNDIIQLRNCRALIVNSDLNICDSVSYILQKIGFRTEFAQGSEEAVLRTKQAVKKGDGYGVYIVDYSMPNMSGIDLVRQIRKESGKEVPIIVLTAYDWTEFQEEAESVGVTAFCSKPIFMSELAACLNSAVNNGAAVKEERKKPRGERILLTEDNVLNQEIAVAILEEAGFKVEVANNGAEAVEKLKGSKPGYFSLVLMDVQMPVMNGYEAAKAIRKLENKELSSIPVFAMTANAFEEDKAEALKSGMNGHIAKPIDVGTLLETLDGILD